MVTTCWRRMLPLLRSLPHHLVAVAFPAAVVDPDRHPRSHQVYQQQREGQADRAAAADDDPQDGRGVDRLGWRPRAGGRSCSRASALISKLNLWSADLDLVTRPEKVGGNGDTVHPGAIAAAPVGDDVPVGLLAKLRVQPGYQGIVEDDVVVLATAERDRRAADHEAPASQDTVQSHNRSSHRAISRSRRSNHVTPPAIMA